MSIVLPYTADTFAEIHNAKISTKFEPFGVFFTEKWFTHILTCTVCVVCIHIWAANEEMDCSPNDRKYYKNIVLMHEIANYSEHKYRSTLWIVWFWFFFLLSATLFDSKWLHKGPISVICELLCGKFAMRYELNQRKRRRRSEKRQSSRHH